MSVNTFRTAIPHSVNPQLRDKVSEAGRDPADLEVISLVGAKVDQNVLVDVLPGPRDSVLSDLDVLAEVVAARGAAAGDETSGSVGDTWRLPTRWSTGLPNLSNTGVD